MPDPEPDVPDVNGGPRRLSGWKEIAGHLDRSVRTVQRWEKDYGLPVRRFGASKPESVFAIRQEIGAWLETVQGMKARSDSAVSDSHPPAGEDAVGAPPPLSDGQSRLPGSQWPWLVRMSGVALAVMLGIGAYWTGWLSSGTMRPPGTPPGAGPTGPVRVRTAWHADVETLDVTDSRGDIVWRYRLPHELRAAAYPDADDYGKYFQALAARGGAPAGAPDTIDPLREFLPILRWDPASRRYVEVPLRR